MILAAISSRNLGTAPMTKLFAVLMVVFVAGARAMAADGLTTIASNFDPTQTAKRLEAEIKAKGMTVFARVDHAAGAKEAGLELRPTEVLIFGSAKAGTPLMQADQTIGIDLPLKVLVWQDAAGRLGSPTTIRTTLRPGTGLAMASSRFSTRCARLPQK